MPVWIDLPEPSMMDPQFVGLIGRCRLVPLDPAAFAEQRCPGIAVEVIRWRWPDGWSACWEPGLGWHSFRWPEEPDRPPRTAAEAWRSYELNVACGMDERAARAELDADLQRIALTENHGRAAGPENARRTNRPREEWLAKAMLLRVRNPEWTHDKIAKEVGVSRTTLWRYEEYRNLTAQVRTAEKPPRGVPTGTDEEGRVTFEPYSEAE